MSLKRLNCLDIIIFPVMTPYLRNVMISLLCRVGENGPHQSREDFTVSGYAGGSLALLGEENKAGWAIYLSADDPCPHRNQKYQSGKLPKRLYRVVRHSRSTAPCRYVDELMCIIYVVYIGVEVQIFRYF